MRGILFRAKRADNGAWETGSLVVIRGGCSDEKVYIADKMTGYLTPVIPKTVGQYTGIKDKNLKWIFEGDIIKCTVIYDTGCYLHFKTEIKEVVYCEGCFIPFYNCERHSFEVIGNIYDNKLEDFENDR